MDRRDFVKGAAAFAAAGLGMSGLSESVKASGLEVVDGKIVATGGPFRWEDKSIVSPVPYDPVAVLEAMRERFSLVDLCSGKHGSARGGWLASLRIDDDKLFHAEFPDFPSTVKWLHRQAAAADPEFAARWPVPE